MLRSFNFHAVHGNPIFKDSLSSTISYSASNIVYSNIRQALDGKTIPGIIWILALVSHSDHPGWCRCSAYGLVGYVGDVHKPPNCCDVELSNETNLCYCYIESLLRYFSYKL